MKLKPVTLVHRPETPAMRAVVTAYVPKKQTYDHLVTRQGVSPDRAKALLGPK